MIQLAGGLRTTTAGKTFGNGDCRTVKRGNGEGLDARGGIRRKN